MPAEVGVLVAFCSFTFFLGMISLGGIVLVFEPDIMQRLTDPSAHLLPFQVPASVARAVGIAMLAFGFSESITGWFSGTPVGDQFAALLGTFSLRPSGYLALAAQAMLIAAITAWASRRTLFATLNDID